MSGPLSRADELLLSGPAGAGKSFIALYKIHLMCLLNGACKKDCAIEHEHHDRGMKALIVRKTHKSLTSTVRWLLCGPLRAAHH